jgi:hypothetical protein
MLKRKKILIFIILIVLASSLGCITGYTTNVNLNFATKKMVMSKDVSSSTIYYQSKYQEPQEVTINLQACDKRIGVSWEPSGTFKPSISWTQKIGGDQPNSKIFYIFILNSSIPHGQYHIYGGIKGAKSNDFSNDTMTVNYQ